MASTPTATPSSGVVSEPAADAPGPGWPACGCDGGHTLRSYVEAVWGAFTEQMKTVKIGPLPDGGYTSGRRMAALDDALHKRPPFGYPIPEALFRRWEELTAAAADRISGSEDVVALLRNPAVAAALEVKDNLTMKPSGSAEHVRNALLARGVMDLLIDDIAAVCGLRRADRFQAAAADGATAADKRCLEPYAASEMAGESRALGDRAMDAANRCRRRARHHEDAGEETLRRIYDEAADDHARAADRFYSQAADWRAAETAR